MIDEPIGEAALEAYNRAIALVKEGKYDEARAVNVFRSDRMVIEAAIKRQEEDGK